MESSKSPYTFDDANKLADLFAQHVDVPQQKKYSNPTWGHDHGFAQFAEQLSQILGVPLGSQTNPSPYNPQQFGETQNPPQYRGIRLLLPQTGGEYSGMQEGRIPGWDGLHQMFLGEMIKRGYPIYGGTGQMPGFESGFNPVGFGQR